MTVTMNTATVFLKGNNAIAWLTRISHQTPAAEVEMGMADALRSVGLLDVVQH